MKELNVLLDKLDKECPHVFNKIDKYGQGKIIQVVIGNKKNKTIQIQKDKQTGVYKTETNALDIIEVLYSTSSEKKKFIKELIEILENKLNEKVVYVSCLSVTKDTALLQLYALDKVNKFKLQ